MDVKSIINQAFTKCKIDINPSAGRKLINEAMEVLALKYDTACVKKEVTFNAIDENNLEFDLPADCIGVVRIKSDIDNRFKRYNVNDSVIYFHIPGNFTVSYLSIPELTSKENYDYTLQDDIPAVNLAFHSALPFYLAANAIINNDTEESDPNKIKLNTDKSNLFMQTFNDLASQADKRLKNIKRKNISIPAPLWR